MDNSQLPVDLLRWILALLPIVVLLVLLVLLGWKAPQAVDVYARLKAGQIIGRASANSCVAPVPFSQPRHSGHE